MKRKGAGSNPLALNKFLENNPDPCNVKVNGLQYFSLEEIAKLIMKMMLGLFIKIMSMILLIIFPFILVELMF